jgi:hypothetical protein
LGWRTELNRTEPLSVPPPEPAPTPTTNYHRHHHHLHPHQPQSSIDDSSLSFSLTSTNIRPTSFLFRIVFSTLRPALISVPPVGPLDATHPSRVSLFEYFALLFSLRIVVALLFLSHGALFADDNLRGGDVKLRACTQCSGRCVKSPSPAMLTLTSELVPGSLIFARDSSCVQGCPTDTPVCNCSSNERCELTAQSCVSCAAVICKTIAKSGGSGISPGAIAGAVIGGLIAVGILAFFIWTRAKRQMQTKRRMSMAATAAEKENDFGMLRSARVQIPQHKVWAPANMAVGIDAYCSFHRFHRPHASLQCHSNRIHSWCHESFWSYFSFSSGTARSSSSILGLARRFPVPSIAEHRHTIRG